MVSAGAVLEVLTGVPADVFDALRPAAQAAVVARIVPDRLRTLDMASAEAVIAVAQRAVNALGAIQELALAACVRREELDLTELDGDWSDGSEHRPSAVKMVASSVAPVLRSTPRGAESGWGTLSASSTSCRALWLWRSTGSWTAGRRASSSTKPSSSPWARGPLRRRRDRRARMPTLTPGRLRGVCERVAVAVDPDAVERRRSSACVTGSCGSSPGSTPAWRGGRRRVPSFASMQAWAAIDELAHEYVRADPAVRSTRRAPTPSWTCCSGSAQVSTTVELVVPTFVGTAQDAARLAPADQTRACAPWPVRRLTRRPETCPRPTAARRAIREGPRVSPMGCEHVDRASARAGARDRVRALRTGTSGPRRHPRGIGWAPDRAPAA